MKRIAVLFSVSILAGCQPDVSDLQVYIQQVSANTKVAIEAYPQFTRKPPFDYQGEQFRNPFQRPKNQTYEVAEVMKENCQQPDFRREKQPLEHYGIDALQFKGSFDSHGQRFALIQATDGGLFKVTKGDRLGLFYGQVDTINQDAVVITEMLPDGTGCWQRKAARLTRATAAGEQDNV